MTRKTRPYRDALLAALADPVEAGHYLNAAIADSEEMFRKACLNVIKARQVAKVAREAEVSRESLYRSFSASGNPSWSTLHAVLESVGLKIRIVAEDESSIGPTSPATCKSPSASPDLLDAAVRQLAQVSTCADRSIPGLKELPERNAGLNLKGLGSSEELVVSPESLGGFQALQRTSSEWGPH